MSILTDLSACDDGHEEIMFIGYKEDCPMCRALKQYEEGGGILHGLADNLRYVVKWQYYYFAMAQRLATDLAKERNVTTESILDVVMDEVPSGKHNLTFECDDEFIEKELDFTFADLDKELRAHFGQSNKEN